MKNIAKANIKRMMTEEHENENEELESPRKMEIILEKMGFLMLKVAVKGMYKGVLTTPQVHQADVLKTLWLFVFAINFTLL